MDRVQAISRKSIHGDVDGYSCFFDNLRLQATGFDFYLKGMDLCLGHIFICALAPDYCVCYSVLDAKNNGFDTYYLSSLTKYIGKDIFESMLIDLKQRGNLFYSLIILSINFINDLIFENHLV